MLAPLMEARHRHLHHRATFFKRMRSASALAIATMFLTVAGCVTPEDSLGSESPLCAPSCELAVDTGPDRAFEPTAALDPHDPARGVIVSTVFRDDAETGSPLRFKVHVTSNRGASFETFELVDLMPPTHPVLQYTILADPMLRWLDDGSLLLFGMGGTGNPPDSPTGALGFTSFDLWVARSFDGGSTWPEGQVIAEGSGVMSLASVGQYHDQPHVALGTDGTILLGWVVVTSKAEDGGTVTQDIVASTSTDGGRTWSAPTLVSAGAFHNARPAITEGGTMFMTYRDYSRDGPARPVFLSRSEDGGTTWEGTDMGNVSSISRPSLAATGNALHLLIAPPQEGHRAHMRLLTSVDDASTWTTNDLDEMEGDGEPIAMLATADDGSVWATWHHVNADNTNEYRAWTRAADGTERTQRISTTPIGPNDPQGIIGWPSLGDYNGLSATPAATLAAWVSGEKSGQDVRAAWLT